MYICGIAYKLCMYLYLCVLVFVPVCVYVYTCTFVCVCVCICVYTFCVRMHVSLLVCVYMSMCTCDLLSPPHRLYHVAQLYIAFTIFLSHALQFYVPMDFIEPPILLKLKLFDTENKKRKKVLRYLVQVAIRTFFVIIMCKSAFIILLHV